MKKISIFLCFALVCVVFFTGNVFAAEELPDFPTSNLKYNHYIIHKGTTGEKTTLVNFGCDIEEDFMDYVYARFAWSDEPDIFQVKFKGKHEFIVATYTLTDSGWSINGNGYETKSSTSEFNLVSNVNRNNLLYTTLDIYNNGLKEELVFPATPVITPTLEQVIQGEVLKLQDKTTETMTTLALCGVGLLASLIGLVILPKILYRFL